MFCDMNNKELTERLVRARVKNKKLTEKLVRECHDEEKSGVEIPG